MELDFTALNTIGNVALQEKTPSNSTPETRTAPQQYKNPMEANKPIESLPEGYRKLQRYIDKNRDIVKRSKAVCKRYQDNIKICGQLQTELVKGVQAGEDIYALFLKACKALSYTTADNNLYQQIEKDIIAIYGEGLELEKPLEIELQQVEDRLEKLTKAVENAGDKDQQKRIKRAIAQHQSEAERIKRQINRDK